MSGTLWQVLAQVLPLLINIWLTPWFIPELGEERIGIFQNAAGLTLLLAQFDGGLGAASQRYFNSFAARGDRVAATRLLVSVSAVLGGVTVVVFGAVFALVPWLMGEVFHVSPAHLDEAVVLVRVLAVLVAVLMVRNLYNALLFSHSRFRITSIGIVVSYLVYLAGLVLTVRQGWGLYGVAGTFVAQQAAGTIVTVPAGAAYVDRRGLRWVDRGFAREFLAYAWRVQLTGLIQTFVAQKDTLVAGHVLGAERSGHIAQGAAFATQLRGLPWTAFGPFYAGIGRTYAAEGAEVARDEAERLQRVWVRALAGYTAVGLPAAYFGVGTWLRASFGFTASPYAVLLFAGSMAAMLPSVSVIWCLTLGRPGLELRYAAVGLAANLVASVAGWWALGLIGVVVGTAVGQLSGTLWLSWAARRSLPVPLESWGRSIPWLRAAAAGVLAWGSEAWLHASLPAGGVGLLLCGVLAVPAMVSYVAAVFGVRGPAEVARRAAR